MVIAFHHMFYCSFVHSRSFIHILECSFLCLSCIAWFIIIQHSFGEILVSKDRRMSFAFFWLFYAVKAAIPSISQINFVVTLWLYRRAGSISFVGNVLNFHCSLVEYSLWPGRTRRSIHQIWILRVDAVDQGEACYRTPGVCSAVKGKVFSGPNIHLTIIDLCLMWQCCLFQLDATLSSHAFSCSCVLTCCHLLASIFSFLLYIIFCLYYALALPCRGNNERHLCYATYLKFILDEQKCWLSMQPRDFIEQY